MLFTRRNARLLLAAIRIFNGTLALVAPQRIVRQFDTDSSPPPVAIYALRMFGIRTILVGLDLLRKDRGHAVSVAPIIHASDLLTAISVARAADIAPKTKALIVSISALNTLLALLMREPEPEAEPFDVEEALSEAEAAAVS